MRFRRGVGAVALAVLVTVAGCGESSRTGDVSGTIAFDGTPVKAGVITFFPADGQAPTKGGPVTDGRYSVKGVPLGQMKVVINGQKVVGEKQVYPGQPNSPVRPITAELLPEKYSGIQESQLRYDVTPGTNEKNFDLSK